MSLGVPPDWPSPVGPYEGKDKPISEVGPNTPTPFVLAIAGNAICRLNRDGSAEFDWKRIEQLAAAWKPAEISQSAIVAKLLVECAEQIRAQTEARFVAKGS